MGCRLVVSDIAPLGIVVAERAGIPSVLVENFTWDWIYQGYSGHNGAFSRHIRYLEEVFQRADYHIQTEPVCRPSHADLTTHPISRRPRTPAHMTRRSLGLPPGHKVVMLTMGGVPSDGFQSLETAPDVKGVSFLVPGPYQEIAVRGNLYLIPHNSGYFHPDLIRASDAIIGKVGYSTLAEVYYAGVPFGYVARKEFRESSSLVSFIDGHMEGIPIEEGSLYDGGWLRSVPDLLSLPRVERRGHEEGAAQAADFICSLPG